MTLLENTYKLLDCLLQHPTLYCVASSHVKNIVPGTTNWDRLTTNNISAVQRICVVDIPDSSQNVARVQLPLFIYVSAHILNA